MASATAPLVGNDIAADPSSHVAADNRNGQRAHRGGRAENMHMPTAPRGRAGWRGAGQGRGRGATRGQAPGGGEEDGRGESGGGEARERARGAQAGQGKGRSRRRSSTQHTAIGATGLSPTLPQPPGLGGGGAFSARLTEGRPEGEGEVDSDVNGEATGDEDEPEICFICANTVIHYSIAPCNHITCHRCALITRALYKNKACPHCRTQWDYVIYTDHPEKKYEEFKETDFVRTDSNLGIKFESEETWKDTEFLLRYNCPSPGCDIACRGWPDLHRHVRHDHHKIMCDLCTRNKKVFTHEHELFTPAELRRHERFGDDHPGAVDQTGFKGHPECGFCRLRFYGDDELYTHCRDKHERCHICDRRSQGRQQQYYVDYNSLEVHFRKDHFLCPEQECLDKKFVVFESEIDIKAHQLQEHPNGLSKDARRDARRVDMSSFDYRQPHDQERGGRREGRGRGGRGRDPNSEPLPQSTAQPMRRDELAYQRQLAIQSAQSVSNRTFGGQLTSTEAYAARPPPRAAEPVTVTAPRQSTHADGALPSLGSLTLDGRHASSDAPPSPVPAKAVTQQEQARLLRHNAVTARAGNMLRNDPAKLDEFRSRVSSYRNSAISAGELINDFFTLFDTSSEELGKLIKELADIFEIPSKKDDLLKAWNDWKAINEDYPSLPGLQGAPASSAGSGGKRVLKLKSSSTQASRQAAAGTSGWPPMPSGVAASATRQGAGKAGVAPWTASQSSRASPAAPQRPPRPAPVKKSNIVNTELFPALPTTAKPTSSIFSPGYGNNAVRRDNSGRNTLVSVWGPAGAANATAPAAANNDNVDDAVVGGKKKGNKNKKQTLFHFG